ncbi:hypothetical protein B1790_05375 [Mycobacterium sp. AT1]|nr:hypothetical protein B1790_05375 [Mycobacterium sp. AT1]
MVPRLTDSRRAPGPRCRGWSAGAAGARPKDDDLRETLLAYLASARGPRAVSEKLHIAPNPAAYRVKQAQRLLPARTDGNPLEVMLALFLARYWLNRVPSRPVVWSRWAPGDLAISHGVEDHVARDFMGSLAALTAQGLCR